MTAPKHLSPEARKLWAAIHDLYDLDAADDAVLLVGLEALDCLRLAQVELAARGVVVESRDGVKANPAATVVAQSRLAFLAAMKQLRLPAEETVATPTPSERAASNFEALRNRRPA